MGLRRLVLCGVVLSSCAVAACSSPSTCTDVASNGAETDIDCGGGTCDACGTGKQCSENADCVTGLCLGEICAEPSCTDEIQDGAETDVDCGGGGCGTCGDGKQCGAGTDCQSGVCGGGVCQTPSCDDGVKNGAETDVDCGGSCEACSIGKGCVVPADCTTSVCDQGLCRMASCGDLVTNGNETDLDCGGPDCADCLDHKACGQGTDCVSAVCSGNVCQVPTCSDSATNGDETDLDCGGGCPACDDTKLCEESADCTSKVCSVGVCQAASCMDTEINGDETDVNCGGGTCVPCPNTFSCVVHADCMSAVCVNDVCVAPSCDDGLANGDETDEDCGGPTCEKCRSGQACLVPSDCKAGTCAGNICNPDPTLLAPALNRTVPTGPLDETDFLYTGPDALQTGVTPGALEQRRIAILQGRVIDAQGEPLPDVEITVLGSPELGRVWSREDGRYDIAVNGGGRITLDFKQLGRISSQRSIEVPWKQFAEMDPVALITLDPIMTPVVLSSSAPPQIALGSPVTDAEGARQARLFFEAGTEASMIVNGTPQPMTGLAVRATEYTVGTNGLAAMPGSLPPTSGYTYAVELSADEAIAAGATSVQFTKPVVIYLENFLDFPVGEVVPAGYYDRVSGVWIPSPNGGIIEVVGVTGGLADLDLDGSGTPADASALTAQGFTTDERQFVATQYTVGTKLWRTRVMHFTPWDCNFPYGPPDDATAPDVKPPPSKDPCEKKGSVIACERQSLGEELPVAGTPHSLWYRSERTPGNTERFTVDIPLTVGNPPPLVKRIELEMRIAGQRFQQSYVPSANLVESYTWDGRDAYGREVQGAQLLVGRIGYVYTAEPLKPGGTLDEAFAKASSSGSVLTGDRGRTEVTLWRDFELPLGAWDARALGLGGWMISAHQAYDPARQILYEADGYGRGAELISHQQKSEIRSYAGGNTGGSSCFDGNNGPASAARFCALADIAMGADGSAYVIDSTAIRRIRPDGIIVHFAGYTTSVPAYQDNVPAINQTVGFARGLAVGPDESVYVATQCMIRKITPDGIIRTIAGMNAMCGFTGDGGPATSARLGNLLKGPAVSSDGTVYFIDDNRIRRISSTGIISTIAGGATAGYSGDGGPALDALLRLQGTSSTDVTIGPDGTVYVADSGNNRVRAIGVDGIIETVAGDGTLGELQSNGQRAVFEGGVATETAVANPTSLAVTPSNDLLIATRGVVRMVRGGIITRVAGQLPVTFFGNGDGDLATRAFVQVRQLSLGPDGAIQLMESCESQDGCRLRRISAPAPGLSVGDLVVPSRDGSDLFVFTTKGKHLRTVDALTGVTKYTFAYDSADRLIEITDRDDGVTTIERDAQGQPTAIAASGGQITELALDANGYLARIESPGGNATQAAYTPSGLMTSLTWPGGNLHTFSWDPKGRLLQDNAPDGWFISLARAELLRGYSVTATNAANRATVYALERFADGTIRRTVTPPTGGALVDFTEITGVRTFTLPSGMKIVESEKGDPRFGTGATYVSSQTVTTPANKVRTYTASRTVTGTTPSESLSISNLTDSYSVNGRTASMSYDTASRTATFTLPTGTQQTLALDVRGRVIEERLAPDATPIMWSWHANGKVAQRTHGTNSLTLAYDASERISRRTDGAGNATDYTYDADDRLASVKTPAGHTWTMGHDMNGALSRVTTPSGIVHDLGRTARNQAGTYSPPGGGTWSRTYTAEGKLLRQSLPSGRTVTRAYNAQGNLQSITYPEATVTMGYVTNTDQIGTVARNASAAGTAILSHLYDGHLVTRYTIGGTQIVNIGWDDNFFLGFYQLVGAPGVSLFRDNDGALTAMGPFSFQRTGPARMQSGATATNHTAVYGYDGLRRPTTKSHTLGGVALYEATLAWNTAGKVAQKVETVQGVTATYDYSYDADGQLVAVTRDAAAHESYAYDMDANRMLRVAGGDVAAATYDANGQLTAIGSTTYVYNVDGQLASRGADTFTYSAIGELIGATVGGTDVVYRYDGFRRRVARVENGVTTQFVYANPNNMHQLSYSTESGVTTAYYYDDAGRLLGFDRAGARHHVATDPLGSPRIITDATGVVLRVLDYDAFGRVIADSDPTLSLPIGFGGYLFDPRTELLWIGMRDYDPSSGRFTARDPVFMSSDHPNLYVYGGNDPVTNKDVLGLTSVEFSALGWGFKIATTPEGASFCGEAGIGIGGGLTFSPNGKLDPPGVTAKFTASAKLGAAGAGVTAKYKFGCGPSAEAKVNIGPVEVTNDGELSVSSEAVELGAKAEAKASIQACVSTAH